MKTYFDVVIFFDCGAFLVAVLRDLFAGAKFCRESLGVGLSFVAFPGSAASLELEGPAEDPDATELAGTIRAEEEIL